MPVAPAPAGGNPVAAPEQSFRERKASQLGAERQRDESEREPTERPDPPQQRTPPESVESAQDLYEDPQGVQADDEYEDDDQGMLEGDPDEGTPPEGELEDGEEKHDWEKRYKDLQAQMTQLTQERGEITQEHTEVMGEALRLKFDLEDRFEEAVGRAEYMANVMGGQAQQYRNINWSQVPAEQLANLQQQAQQAFMIEQQANAAWDEVKRQKSEALQTVKSREAAIAKIRLKRTIGLNNEVYGELREFAGQSGMAPEAFNQITDPVIMEWAADAMKFRNAGNKVRVKDKRKAQVPRGRNAKQAPRDARGKFAKTDLVPNQRGSFADKHKHRLAMERQGR